VRDAFQGGCHLMDDFEGNIAPCGSYSSKGNFPRCDLREA
jgi:hypothetical protein